ncbi:TPA: hypothetical protein HA249_00685 [Candidatus Woesearchaeota archaeon]|nr:MAG: hypothetical protein QT07_C0008G0001 [archaeon GW2011_AR16]HIG95394.1 hypothetical protein [Candidatus Woesearchaeota archaeon]HIH47822.1 hypothetical protein [Candidatus Woesearchaeota archaeon]HII88286.1 hypothetical protein [Candidatus Woesearchaeota archaeon]
METTTVKLQKTTKLALDHLKLGNETYNQVINKLIQKTKKDHLRHELIEGYKNRGEDALRLLHEWDAASAELEHE